MKRLKDYCRFVLISVETLWVLLCISIFLTHPSWLEKIGVDLQKDDKSIEVVFALPAVILAFSFALAKSILFPSKSLKKELKQWPDYQGLWDRVIFTMITLCISTLVGGILWVWRTTIPSDWLVSLTAICIGISGIGLISLALASLFIRRILDEHVEGDEDE
jgi:hypothetical protein